jgi:hypothetical protein
METVPSPMVAASGAIGHIVLFVAAAVGSYDHGGRMVAHPAAWHGNLDFSRVLMYSEHVQDRDRSDAVGRNGGCTLIGAV